MPSRTHTGNRKLGGEHLRKLKRRATERFMRKHPLMGLALFGLMLKRKETP